MAVHTAFYTELKKELDQKKVTLVAVSKTKSVEDIEALYQLGQRDFGENYVQELTDKQKVLPADIRWHFIGHLQSNKVKYIAPFVHLIHGVDSLKLLKEINKQGQKLDRIISVLLQVHIAQEETKFGLDDTELGALVQSPELEQCMNIRICGLMGMASFTEDKDQVIREFEYLASLYHRYTGLKKPNCDFQILSMGMSGDYSIALEAGSNLVRIGSLLFGARN